MDSGNKSTYPGRPSHLLLNEFSFLSLTQRFPRAYSNLHGAWTHIFSLHRCAFCNLLHLLFYLTTPLLGSYQDRL